MIIKYIIDNGMDIVEEEIDYSEFHEYTLNGDVRPSILCRRSKDNKKYIKSNYNDVFSNYFEVPVSRIFTIIPRQ